MIDEKRLSSEFDFNGRLSDLIQVTKAHEKAGLSVGNMINVLRRPDKKEVLKEINEYCFRKKEIETLKKLEEMKAQEKYGIVSNNSRPDFSDLLNI